MPRTRKQDDDDGGRPAPRRSTRSRRPKAFKEFAGVHACVDRAVPPELTGVAIAAAIDERPDNVLGPGAAPPGAALAMNSLSAPAIAVVVKKLWSPGRTLRVRFLDRPAKKVRDEIERFAHRWEEHAGIAFDFGDHPKAEIRITCTLGQGSWSYLGTDALTIPAGQPTMNYGWFTAKTPEDEFSRTVLHEFGHALGCIHEHMNPRGEIPWNREAVYRFYTTTQGWSRKEVDDQLFARYALDQTNGSEYDPESIMHYPVPKELTTDGSEVGWNRELSERDRDFIAQIYPR